MRRLWSLLLLFAVASPGTLYGQVTEQPEGPDRPNILWLTSEDNGQEIGAYGDPYAITPNLDALASRGMRFQIVWSDAPVCAPARTSIISGMWTPSIGAENMRSISRLPENYLLYPQYLRQAGYFTSNNVKEDFNIEPIGQLWDAHSTQADWEGRRSGQPFFSIYNSTRSHEGQIRSPSDLEHDPDALPLPAYHPDTPEVRRDWAQYYQIVTNMDRDIGEWLEKLEASGEAENTIIFYYGDHGSGMPRSKRFPYNSGLEVPLIVYFPEKWRHLAPADYVPGGVSMQPVAFMDLAPTLLSIAGIEPPAHMHGQALMGSYVTATPRRYLFGFRNRMDERYDLMRSVRDERYVYIRNYMPHRIYGQHLAYMFGTPTTRVWRELYEAGALEPPQTYFWQTKPVEELYDLWEDPDEVKNLTGSPAHLETLQRLREVNRQHMLERRDLGFLPETELHMRVQQSGLTPYELAQDESLYPMQRVMETAELASSLSAGGEVVLVDRLGDRDSAVRYWAATGLLMRGEGAVLAARLPLFTAMSDESAAVRVAAAEALGRYGDAGEQRAALTVLLELSRLDLHSFQTALLALNAIEYLGERARPIIGQVAALPREQEGLPNRYSSYVPRVIEHILSQHE